MPYNYLYGYRGQPLSEPILQEEAEEEMINNFRVGCDPEFILVGGSGQTIPASLHFPQYGEIGYDHNGRVAEFRPGPSRGILPIVRKIQGLIKDKRIPPAKLRAGALVNHDSLGGHVHFGFNCFEEKPLDGHSILTGGGKFTKRGADVTAALDQLTRVLEHLDILPRDESAARRSNASGYGKYRDVRDCAGHMEYRTMASWLFDPKVAFLCLTAAKIAATDPEGSLEALKNCDSWKDFGAWLDCYKNKDINAARASEKLVERGLKYVQVDPTVDFRERWEGLGVV